MSKDTAVNWADHSWTPWEGCTKQSLGCRNCYAEVRDGRNLSGTGPHWGPGQPREEMAESNWRQPLSWESIAAKTGTQPIVLAGELCDWCDDDPGVPNGARTRMWDLIRQTPHLRWALLTKRTEKISCFLPEDWGEGWDNVVLGATVEDRATLSRIDDIRAVSAKARFLSIEPLLESLGEVDFAGINWVILGGESGHTARTFRPEWAESILRQCREQGIPFWMKQLGAAPVYLDHEIHLTDLDKNHEERRSNNGEDWNRWPVELGHLKVRELPDLHPEHLHDASTRHKEAQLATIEAGLEKLAEGLNPDLAAKELELRREFISAERNLFLTRLERARILGDFKAIYGPARKWSQFLRTIGIARRTAYDLLDVVAGPGRSDTTEGNDCAGSAQSRTGGEFVYEFDAAVEKGVKALNRLFRRFSEPQRQQALQAILDRLGASISLPKAA